MDAFTLSELQKLKASKDCLSISKRIPRRGGPEMNINKNDVLTFLAAVASIINVIMNWLA